MSTKVSGELRADRIAVAKLTVDRLKDPPKVEVLAGLTDSTTGQTHGWVDQTNVMFSEDTKRALSALMSCLEQDLARAHFKGEVFSDAEVSSTEPGLRVPPAGGLGEYLANEDGPRSI